MFSVLCFVCPTKYIFLNLHFKYYNLANMNLFQLKNTNILLDFIISSV